MAILKSFKLAPRHHDTGRLNLKGQKSFDFLKPDHFSSFLMTFGGAVFNSWGQHYCPCCASAAAQDSLLDTVVTENCQRPALQHVGSCMQPTGGHPRSISTSWRKQTRVVWGWALLILPSSGQWSSHTLGSSLQYQTELKNSYMLSLKACRRQSSYWN